jgi:hypothetical protein
MIGETIAHYRVTAKIGEGGMGEVYGAIKSGVSKSGLLSTKEDISVESELAGRRSLGLFAMFSALYARSSWS